MYGTTPEVRYLSFYNVCGQSFVRRKNALGFARHPRKTGCKIVDHTDIKRKKNGLEQICSLKHLFTDDLSSEK